MVRVRARPPHQQHSPPAGEQPPRSVPRARPAARATRRGPDTVTGPRVWHQDIHNKMGMQGGLKLFIEITIKGTGLACPAPYSQAS